MLDSQIDSCRSPVNGSSDEEQLIQALHVKHWSRIVYYHDVQSTNEKAEQLKGFECWLVIQRLVISFHGLIKFELLNVRECLWHEVCFIALESKRFLYSLWEKTFLCIVEEGKKSNFPSSLSGEVVADQITVRIQERLHLCRQRQDVIIG